MDAPEQQMHPYWKQGPAGILVIALVGVLIAFAFRDGLADLYVRWSTREEYGHGFLLPVIAAYFLWQDRVAISRTEFRPSWAGAAVLVVACAAFLVGDISNLWLLEQYAFILALFGISLALFGWCGVKFIRVPLILLFFAIPLPAFVQVTLSIKLQMLSTQLGVGVIKLAGIPVFVEGNVIDLGIYKLQVAEACSGLRYLFSLMSFGFICAVIYRVERWKRVVVFLSTIPITVLMNSFRIGVIGILVDNFGIHMAEGFMHDFEGWSIFGACLALLFLEMWALTKVGKRMSFRAAFGLDEVERFPVGTAFSRRPLSKPLLVCVLIIVTAAGVAAVAGGREQHKPLRKPLVLFPDRVGDWAGHQGRLEADTLRTLELSDYVIADYSSADPKAQVNFYVAYYETQHQGASVHSPEVCIPAGGWEIGSISRREFPFSTASASTLSYNRVVIRKGLSKQLVYYWFQQRGRTLANEFHMKWYIFMDAIRHNRTDGALVRLTTPILPGESEDAAERRLQEFAYQMMPALPEYVPD